MALVSLEFPQYREGTETRIVLEDDVCLGFIMWHDTRRAWACHHKVERKPFGYAKSQSEAEELVRGRSKTPAFDVITGSQHAKILVDVYTRSPYGIMWRCDVTKYWSAVDLARNLSIVADEIEAMDFFTNQDEE